MNKNRFSKLLLLVLVSILVAGCNQQVERGVYHIPNSDLTFFEKENRLLLQSDTSTLLIADKIKSDIYDNFNVSCFDYNKNKSQLALLVYFYDERTIYIINTNSMQIINSFPLTSEYRIPCPWQAGIHLSDSANYLVVITTAATENSTSTKKYDEDSRNIYGSALFLYDLNNNTVDIKFFEELYSDLNYGSMYDAQVRFYDNEKKLAILGGHYRENVWTKFYIYEMDFYGCFINLQVDDLDNIQIYHDLPKRVLKKDIEWLMESQEGQKLLTKAKNM